jgi:integration host factor subunit beta
MTKSDLIRVISVKNDLPIDQAETIVNTFWDSLADALRDGRRIELRGFGSFRVRDYDGYLGRNPRNGESVTVPPKRMPFFKMGKEIKEALNDGN